MTKAERKKVASEYGEKIRERTEFYFYKAGFSDGEAIDQAIEEVGELPSECHDEKEEWSGPMSMRAGMPSVVWRS